MRFFFSKFVKTRYRISEKTELKYKIKKIGKNQNNCQILNTYLILSRSPSRIWDHQQEDQTFQCSGSRSWSLCLQGDPRPHGGAGIGGVRALYRQQLLSARGI